MDLSSGTDRYEVVTWTGELPTFLDFNAPARKRLPYWGDWAPWIPFPFRISLTYGTERHTEAEIKKRLGTRSGPRQLQQVMLPNPYLPFVPDPSENAQSCYVPSYPAETNYKQVTYHLSLMSEEMSELMHEFM